MLVERAGEVVTREEIQQLTWSNDTVVDFEVGINRCIRRIRSALLDDAEAPRYLETVPRVGYRFIAPVEGPATVATETVLPAEVMIPPPPLPTRPAVKRKALVLAALAALSLSIALAGILWFSWHRSHLPADLDVVPLAVSLGDQFTPTFSPDGRQVAFTWNGESQDNFDIYLKLVSSSSPALRLTTNKDVDYSPAWSPDGEWIAFCRGSDTRGGAIWVVPSLGGAERKIIELNALGNPWNRAIAWSHDSKHLVVSVELAGQSKKGLHLVNISTGAISQMTTPAASEEDMHPAVSPNGRTIAFTRDVGRGVSSILLVPFAGGTPHTIPAPQAKHVYNARPAWTPDGSHVTFVSNAGGDSHLWLSPVQGSGTPQEITGVGDGVQDAVLSTTGQLSLVRQTEDSNLWTVDLRSSVPNELPKARRIFASTRTEESPAVRPDGQQIAFASNRSGYGEIWTGRVDGSDAMQVTYLENPVTGSPDWAPDGHRLVFDSRAGGRPQLYLMSADGGKAVVLPTGEGISVVPHWSPDGRYIYFSSDRTGRMEIWRVPSTGGVPEQITKEGGFAAVPSPDGASIYYSSDNESVSSLWELRIATGQRTLVTSSVIRRAYAPSAQGVYFFSGSTGQDPSALYFFDKQSLGKTPVFRTDRRLVSTGMTLAPDGHALYYTQLDTSGHQLLLVPNFWK